MRNGDKHNHSCRTMAVHGTTVVSSSVQSLQPYDEAVLKVFFSEESIFQFGYNKPRYPYPRHVYSPCDVRRSNLHVLAAHQMSHIFSSKWPTLRQENYYTALQYSSNWKSLNQSNMSFHFLQ